MRCSNKDLDRLVRIARQSGWTVRQDGADHLRVEPPTGGAGVSVSTTRASSRRAYLNTRALLRRKGLVC